MARYVIYWLTSDASAKRRIKARFRIRGENVNGESEAYITDTAEAALFMECARRGFFKIRNK